MSIQGYTCGFMIDDQSNVLLVEKLKPAWQAGKLNGIGGKIEPGEEPFACMRREWQEETGHSHDDWDHVCSLRFDDAEVHFFRALVLTLPLHEFNEVNDAGEKLCVAWANKLPHYVIPNLNWLIPLCLDPQGSIGGKIEEQAA